MFKNYPVVRLILCVVLLFLASSSLQAQTEQEVAQASERAAQLFSQQRFAEAVPDFEIVIKAMPDEPKVRFLYGFCLLAKSKQVSSPDEAKQLSAKALDQFKEAKRLGMNDPTNETLISMLSGAPPPTSSEPSYSANPQAEKTMMEAEGLFAQSKYDEAIKLFEKALSLDPKLYQAAVSGGDCFVAKNDWDSAEKWYQRAIAIDPNRETAYRYSGTPFMKQNKYDQARERYIEAYIVEPYNRMSLRGIDQWAQITDKSLGHPKISVPEFTFDVKGKAVPNSAIDPKDAAASPWLAYLSTRESWKNGKFAKTFPQEKEYRHSLQEEAESLRAAIKSAVDRKSLDKQFEILGRLDKEGLLEAFVLMTARDEGVAHDHPDYLKNNRPKLRLYVANYVIQN